MNINEIIKLGIEDEQYKVFLYSKLLEEEDFDILEQLSDVFTEDDVSNAYEVLTDELGEISSIERWYNKISIDTSYSHYWLIHEYDVYDVCYDELKAFLDDCGYEGFSPSFIEDCIDIDKVRDWVQSDMQDYYYEWQEDELREELERYDIEIDEDEDPYDYRYELAEKYVENRYDSDLIQELKDYGIDLDDFIDDDELIDSVIRCDGEASILATYDGREEELTINGERYYLYKR